MKKKNCYDANDFYCAEIPEFVYEPLARSLLPVIQKYCEGDKGKRAFAEWKEKKKLRRKILHKRTGRIAMFGSPPGFAFSNLQFPQYKQ